jgi:hypothetical protein
MQQLAAAPIASSTATFKGEGRPISYQQPNPIQLAFQEDCRLIHLPKITDSRGSLSFIEAGRHIPFKIGAAYWLNDMSGLENRQNDSFGGQQEFIISISGSIEVSYDNGWIKKSVRLDRPDQGLLVSNKAWRRVEKLSTNAVVLVLTSQAFQEEEATPGLSWEMGKIQ